MVMFYFSNVICNTSETRHRKCSEKAPDQVNHVRVHGLCEGPRSVDLPMNSKPFPQRWTTRPLRAMDHLMDRAGSHGSQAESTRSRRQTTGPFTGRGPDDGPWWCLWKPFQNPVDYVLDG
uniref:Uncharacterized protein n=1 Tax=Solanum tuberosum TaxID=4113 RepID=M1DW32_SOLTU